MRTEADREASLVLEAARCLLNPDVMVLILIGIDKRHAQDLCGRVEAVLEAARTDLLPRQSIMPAGPVVGRQLVLASIPRQTRVFVHPEVAARDHELMAGLRVWSAMAGTEAP